MSSAFSLQKPIARCSRSQVRFQGHHRLRLLLVPTDARARCARTARSRMVANQQNRRLSQSERAIRSLLLASRVRTQSRYALDRGPYLTSNPMCLHTVKSQDRNKASRSTRFLFFYVSACVRACTFRCVSQLHFYCCASFAVSIVWMYYESYNSSKYV